MNDSIDAKWLMLIHHLPPKPDYFRVRIRRRLQQIGALPVKNAVYVLPATEQATEDFEWLAQEIRRDGGQAIVVAARLLSGLADQDLQEEFRAISDRGYDYIVAAPHGLGSETAARAAAIAQLEQQLEKVAARDQFGG